jgi:ubiquinol-cytochrome c reductase cytochrome c1 subunit
MCLLAGWSVAAHAATEAGFPMQPAHNDVGNTASLQRGAKYFVNYCQGCHSAEYVRYNRLGEDLELTDDELVNNIMFTGKQIFDTMENAMPADDSARWFGKTPPDLSLIARSRGTDYVFNFLRAFYAEAGTPTGANNMVLANTSMPHVLWELQGIQEAVFEEPENGAGEPVFAGFEMMTPGTLSAQEYDQVVRDIVNFLDYISEPMQLQRRSLGIKVIAFLLIFMLFAYLLKREIWKDVH